MRIAQEVSQKLDTSIEVLPMDQINDEDWISPHDFRQLITEIAQWDFNFDTPAIPTRSTATATKYATVTANNQSYTLSITGVFQTQLNEFLGQQFFLNCTSVTSRLTGATGTWVQTGYEKQLLDGGRTFEITVSGTLTVAGARFENRLARVEFYCNNQGVVS